MHRRIAMATGLSVALIAVLAGCQREPEEVASPAEKATPAAAAPAVPPVDAVRTTNGAPDLRIPLLDGSGYDLADHRGKWVVVNFWATWCAPCREEMPELSALDAMHEHIEVIGLAYEDIEPKALREFLAEHPVVYPIAIVDTYDPPADFETPRGLPMTYLIAPDGTVARQVVGPVSAREIEEAIAANGGPPANASS